MTEKGKSLLQRVAETKAALAEKREEVAEWIQWVKSPDGKRAVFAWTVGVVGLTACIALIGLGTTVSSKPQTAEPTPITFTCSPDDDLAATWMRYQLEGVGPGEQDDIFVAASDSQQIGDFALVSGDVFRRGAGQRGFSRVYVPPSEAKAFTGVKASCPVLPLAPAPTPTLRP